MDNANIHYHQIKVVLQGQHNTPSMEMIVTLRGKYKSAAAFVLLDSSATGNIISRSYVRKHRMKEHTILQKIELLNANNSKSLITTQVPLIMEITNGSIVHTETIDFYVGDIGLHKVILGTPWLIKHNPIMDWKKYIVELTQCKAHCYNDQDRLTLIARGQPRSAKLKTRATQVTQEPTIAWSEEELEDNMHEQDTTALIIAQALFHEKEPKEDDQELTPVLDIFRTQLTKHQEKQRAQGQRDNPLSWSRVQWNQFYKKLRAQTVSPVMVPKASNTSQQLAQKGLKGKPQKTAVQIVPHQYHNYLSVFDEKEAD
jgi:hypothetical protein